MSRHPEASEEGDWELEHKGCDMGREGDEAKVKQLRVEDKMIENIVQNPLQYEIQPATGTVTEQFQAHHFTKRRIEEVDDRSQGVFCPGFYVFQG